MKKKILSLIVVLAAINLCNAQKMESEKVFGGFLVGVPQGNALAGEDADWRLAGIGAGLIVIGNPLTSTLNKKSKQVVEVYNSSLNKTSFLNFKSGYKVIVHSNGFGFATRF